MPAVHAQVTTAPVGYVTVTVPANSDATVSPVMARSAAYSGTIVSIVDADTVTLSGDPAFTVDEFAATDVNGSNSYYVQVTSGDRNGLWAVVSANGTGSVDLTYVTQDLGSVSGDQVVVGDSVEIIPFWTPATLFPDTDTADLSQILVFSRSVAGTNVSAGATYTKYDGFGWYNGPTDVNNWPIYPDESLIFRNKSGSSQSLLQSGRVPMTPFRTVLSQVSAGTAQDIRLTSGLPIDVTLQELVDAGASSNGDQILLFNNTQAGENKSAATTATYFDGFGWYNGPTNVNSLVIPVGQGLIYRKVAGNTTDLIVNLTPAYQL